MDPVVYLGEAGPTDPLAVPTVRFPAGWWTDPATGQYMWIPIAGRGGASVVHSNALDAQMLHDYPEAYALGAAWLAAHAVATTVAAAAAATTAAATTVAATTAAATTASLSLSSLTADVKAINPLILIGVAAVLGYVLFIHGKK